jgi:hypothetical protein
LKRTAKFLGAALVVAALFTSIPAQAAPASETAISAVGKLLVRGKAPMTGYERSAFSDGWASIGSCDMRNFILKRDLTNLTWRERPDCTVNSGVLKDPYTGKTIKYLRGVKTSMAVQIDHVVALAAAWRTGAQNISAELRYELANDPLNLLAVDGPTNSKKSDADAATWLPPKKSYRCKYIARQVAVKVKYQLWLVQAEKDAMMRVLETCPGQLLPN